MAVERRRDVRVRPTQELPLTVTLESDAGDGTVVGVLDISHGGFGLHATGPLLEVKAGDRLHLRLEAMGKSATVLAEVRHNGAKAGTTGVMFVDIEDPAKRLIRRYIAEMFERGLSA